MWGTSPKMTFISVVILGDAVTLSGLLDGIMKFINYPEINCWNTEMQQTWNIPMNCILSTYTPGFDDPAKIVRSYWDSLKRAATKVLAEARVV